MLGTVALSQRRVEDYVEIAGAGAIAELRALAAPLRGVRAVNLSLSAFGTGVTDLLSASVPLLQDLGIDATWYVVRSEHEYEAALRALYAAMNGAADVWAPDSMSRWERFSRASLEALGSAGDVVIVHDPQLAGMAPETNVRRNGSGRRWVWHSHHDLSAAAEVVSRELGACASRFDALIVEHPAFAPADWLQAVPAVIPPAIDPLGPRNVALDRETAVMLLRRFGIDTTRPFISQISPLDEGSDLHGLIEVFDRLRPRFPDLQLVIVPTAVRDVQETRSYFDRIVGEARAREGCIVLPVAGEIGNAEINAVQQLATVVVQKSLQRGFALWLSEAMWKERPIVAGRTTGTVAQVIDGSTGFLVPDTTTCTAQISVLLEDAALRDRMGKGGRDHVREWFLITRYLAETLRVLARVVDTG
ncbi:MAG: glycosyltransferase [Dehalococcoidia bacterium]